jgi:hypothetical protein
MLITLLKSVVLLFIQLAVYLNFIILLLALPYFCINLLTKSYQKIC